MIAQYVPYAMAAILVAAMGLELRTGRIPNWLTLLPFVLFIAMAATMADRSILIWQLVIAAVVFGIGIALFVVAGVGAGAVKLLTGLTLFIPPEKGFFALGVFVAVLLIGAPLIVYLRKVAGAPESTWHVMAKPVMPLSVPIGLTGLAVLLVF